MEPEGSLPQSQVPATCPYPEPARSSIYNGPTNTLACNKTLIQMSHIKTLKITPTCFDYQMIIIRELFDPG
jgi:hypothetical protein